MTRDTDMSANRGDDTSAMAREIRQTPEIVARFLEREGPALADLGTRLRSLDPKVIVTCARGSSDNAGGYFKYLTEILVGLPVASIGPSVASIYGAPLRLAGAVVVSISQSGQSPDIVALQASARRAGALAIAVVNDAASPLAMGADAVVPIHAGVETSVAATKTFLASAVALAALVAEWTGDEALRTGLRALPDSLATAVAADWSEAVETLHPAASAYVVGRGPAFPCAIEAALKLKETAVLHAEAFSAAEVMHGPLQLLTPDFPIIALRPDDAAHAAMGASIDRLTAAGGRVLTAEVGPAKAGRLPFTPSRHALLDPLAMLASFYDVAEAVARARGQDPDRPSHLRKVTETV